MVVVAVYAPPKLRYARISKRKVDRNDDSLRNRTFTKQEAESRDYAEIENIEKGGPIAMADYTLVNTQDVNYLNNQLRQVSNEIENN